MLRRFQLFVRGLSVTVVGTAGVVLTTSSFVVLLFMLLLQAVGLLTNSYAGLLTFLLLPGLFLLGLVLIPIGWYRFRKLSGRNITDLLEDRFPDEMVRSGPLGSGVLGMIALLTVVNLVFLGLGGASILHHMDSPEFCGTTCHQVMNPEWVTYQTSPHAHVKCVECHVGEGFEALVDAKLNGLRQVWLVTTGGYRRPIPTPVHDLRPARETCEKCHWPDKFYGERIKRITRYALDEASTPRRTTLALKVGAGGQAGTIHWHVSADNEVRYVATDDERMQMAWVEVKRDGEWHRFTNRGALLPAPAPGAEPRTMDCVDCHNRATHIYRQPDDVVDRLIDGGEIDRAIPYAKAVGLAALTADSSGTGSAHAAIRDEVLGHYRRERPEVLARFSVELDGMVAALQAAHDRNIHPHMQIDWSTYPSHLGHRDGRAGCFRCHNREMVDEDGEAIPADCTLCHSMLSYESPGAFEFLAEPATAEAKDPNRALHTYLRDEFLQSGR